MIGKKGMGDGGEWVLGNRGMIVGEYGMGNRKQGPKGQEVVDMGIWEHGDVAMGMVVGERT